MKRQLVGVVVSDAMDKSCVVEVQVRKMHPIYKKSVKRRKKCMVHDPQNLLKIGQQVRIEEDRPRSKNKNWRIVEVLEN